MKLLTKKLKFQKGKKQAKILATSCWHWGQPAISQSGIFNFLKETKKHQWLHHGDIIEGITPTDRRFEAESHSATLNSCIMHSADMLKNNRENCEGFILGNHEHTPSKIFGDVGKMICDISGVPYLSAVAFIKWQCPKGEFSHFVCHGNGSANYRTGEPERRKINQKLKLRSILDSFDADLKGMGHLHTSISVGPCDEKKLSVLNGKLDRHPVQTRSGWAYAAPSMFKTYNEKVEQTNYGEMKIYPATDIGWIEVIVNEDASIDRILEINEHGELIGETTRTVV